MKKKILAIVLSLMATCSAFAFTACNKGGGESGQAEQKADKQAYVNLDINPEIELIVDKDNNVVSVRGDNEDGLVLLYQESGIEGEKIDAAIRKITDLAVRYGYLDESNKVVDTIVSSGDSDFAAEITSKVNATITATAENLGLSVTTDGDGAYSLLRKMDEVKKQFPNNKAVQNMTVSKFKLAMSVSETGEISIDAAIALDDAQLIDMLKEASPKIEEYATAAYLEAKAKALAIYDEATSLAEYAVYTQYYAENMLTHPLTAYYGGTYQAYASSAKGFNVICDLAELAANIDNYPLDEKQVEAVVTALGMESADALKDANGNITVNSVEAYADKLFKNTPASETLEQTKAALTEALSAAETVIKDKVNEIAEEYKPQIEAEIERAKAIMKSLDDMMNAMPETVKKMMDETMSDIKEAINEITDIAEGGEIKLDVLRAEAARLEKKANEYLDKIKADLSEEEWKEVEARKAAVVAKMSEQKKALDKAMDDAAKAAKDYLAGLKEARKTDE